MPAAICCRLNGSIVIRPIRLLTVSKDMNFLRPQISRLGVSEPGQRSLLPWRGARQIELPPKIAQETLRNLRASRSPAGRASCPDLLAPANANAKLIGSGLQPIVIA